MKRIIITLLITLTCYSFQAQTVVSREENDKLLILRSSLLATNSILSLNTGVSLSFITNKVNGDTFYDIGLYLENYDKFFCQKGCKAIFKTFSGSIITLYEYWETGDVIYFRQHADNRYAITPRFVVIEEDLKKLINEGVEFIRVETIIGLMDFTYKEDIIGGFLGQEYALVNSKKDFSSDF